MYATTHTFANVLFAIVCFVFLIGITHVLIKNRTHWTYKIIYIVFILYTILGLFHYDEICKGIVGHSSDELRYFLPFAESCIGDISIGQIFRNSLSYNHGEGFGYLFYIGLVAKFCYSMLGNFNVFQLVLSSIVLGVLYAVILNNILVNYTTSKNAFKYTIFYMICSPIFITSISIWRDGFIALLYLIGFRILLGNHNMTRTILLCIVAYFISTLRMEHALFFALFIVYDVYQLLNKNKLLFAVISISVLIAGFAFLRFSYGYLGDTYLEYVNYTKDHANASGLAMILLTLPSPIKEFCCTIFSQMFPIPPWVYISDGVESFSDFVVSAMKCVSTIVWFSIVFRLTYWMFVRCNRKILGNRIPMLLLISLLLVVGCSSEYYEVRRLLCVYPMFFLAFILIKERLSQKCRINSLTLFVALYAFLLVSYLIIS